MALNNSADHFFRLLQQKHQELKQSADEMLRIIAGEDHAAKKTTAENLISKANSLQTLFVRNETPSWLPNLISQTSNYVTGGWQPGAFLSSFVQTKREMDSHVWQFDQTTESAINFDAIFEEYKKQSRLPVLFDEILQLLSQIEASGEIDSVSMLQGLDKVIATIRKCKDGSYFSLNSAWQFLMNFLQNYMWGELSNLPVVGPMLEALKKTIEATDEEMFKLHVAVKEKTEHVISSEIKHLSEKTPMGFITYDRRGQFLSSNTPPRLTGTNA